MKNFKYILSVILAVMTMFVCGSTAAYAIEPSNMDATAVLDDLQNSTINGEPFNVKNFPYNENGKVKLLVLTEFCFSYKSSLASNFALYVYVYNPTGKAIYTNKNSIQMASAYANGEAVRYDKYDLKLCNASVGETKNLFYKFRVIDDGSIYSRVSKDNAARRYDISGIELNYTGTAEDFDVGNKWLYSGFAKGCGADENAESTLNCITNSLDTVRLDVNSTYFRYNNGKNTQTQIDSVYFGVDNVLLQKYGTLQKIHAEWLKARTSDVIVLKDASAYVHFDKYIGTDFTNSENPCDHALVAFDRWSDEHGNKQGWSYNLTHGDIFNRTDKLPYLFDASQSDGVVTSAEMKEYIKWYSNKFGNKTVAGKYSSDLFSQVDSRKTDTTIDADSTFDLNGFTTGLPLQDWFDKLFNPSLQDETIKGIKPIYIVQADDLKGSDYVISQRLFVAEQDVEALKAAFKSNNEQGKTTVLFRFATSEYESWDAKIHKHGNIFAGTLSVTVGYLAQETVYLDFDIIDLTFVKKDVATVMPVVSNPIDVIAGLTPPPTGNAGGLPLWVLLVIGIAALILILIFRKPIADILMLVSKVIWTVITAPFKLLSSLFKGRR